MPETMKTLVAAVREHAFRNYGNRCWDVIIECYEDEELAEIIAGARTVGGAIRNVAQVVRLLDERRRDIEGTAW